MRVPEAAIACVVIVAFAGATSVVGSIVDAQERGSLSALCEGLRDDGRDAGLGPVVCRAVARDRSGATRAALVRVSNDRSDELLIASLADDGWHVVGRAGRIYNFQDARGAIELASFALREVIPGGTDEIDVSVRRWQSVIEPPGACSIRRQWELHRYVGELHEGTWRCAGFQIEALPAAAVVLEDPCAPVSTVAAPSWGVALTFTDSLVVVTRRSGAPPDLVQQWLGVWPLHDLFDTPRPRASPPDTL